MVEKFNLTFKAAFKLVNQEILKASRKNEPPEKILKLKLLSELIKEQVPNEDLSHTTR